MGREGKRAILLAVLLVSIIGSVLLPSFPKPTYRYQNSMHWPLPVFFGTHFRTLQGLVAEVIDHNGGLPRGDATLLMKPKDDLRLLPASTHPMQRWTIEAVEIKDFVTDGPQCQVVMEMRVRYGDEDEAILQWTRLDSCFHLGPVVISQDSGRPWGIMELQES